MESKEIKILNEKNEFINEYHKIGREAMTELIKTEYNKYLPSLPNDAYKIILLQSLMDIDDIKMQNNKSINEIILYEEEIKFLKGIENDKTRRLMYSVICHKKLNNHPSGWIKFDFKNVIKYGFYSKDIKKKNVKQEDFMACGEYEFKLMVRGMAEPILCYNIPEMTTEGSKVAVRMLETCTLETYRELFEV